MEHAAEMTKGTIPAGAKTGEGLLGRLVHRFKTSSIFQSASFFALGDFWLVISGLFTPDGKGKSYNPDKIKAGLAGFPNSFSWFVAREATPFDKVLGELGELCDQAVKGQGEQPDFTALNEKNNPSDKVKNAIERFRDNAMSIGSFAFVPNGFFLMRSGMKRMSFGGKGAGDEAGGSHGGFNGGVSEMTHGAVNMASYALLGGLPNKTINFKESYSLTNPKDQIELLQRYRSRISSTLDVATTGLGFLTAGLDLIGRKTPLAGGLAQLFVSGCYLVGSAKIGEFDKQAEKAAHDAGIVADTREGQLDIMVRQTADMLQSKNAYQALDNNGRGNLIKSATDFVARHTVMNREEKEYFQQHLQENLRVAPIQAI
jgi:hypothetical protein